MDKDSQEEVQWLVSRADVLLSQAQSLTGIAGIGKLIKRIQSERAFLKSLQEDTITIKENQLKSTNLSHLEGLLHSAKAFERVTSVLQTFHFEDSHGIRNSVEVDVVANGGLSWVKVTARKAKALHRIWEGDGEYRENDITEQAKQYLQASQQHPLNYSPPNVNVVFYGGVTQAIVDDLNQLGITAHGHVFPTPEDVPLQLPDTADTINISTSPRPAGTERPKVNLDVTTLVALVSELTHGGCGHTFNEPLIQKLAEQERKRPLVPEVEEYLKDKDLYACETAITDFKNILKTIAGPGEKKRAQSLLSRLTVVPDDPSERAANMDESQRIKLRTKVIFGTGDKLKAITITANEGFVRAARNKGVSFAVQIHQSRALTEKKQKVAPKANSPSQQHEEQELSDTEPSDDSLDEDTFPAHENWGKPSHMDFHQKRMQETY